MAFEHFVDNGGSAIVTKTLYMTEATTTGESSELYQVVSSYDGSSMEFVVDQAVEASMESGKIYRFRLSATNLIGEGELSDPVSVALIEPAAVPNAPTFDISRSTETTRYIKWEAVTPADGHQVLGYAVDMTELGSGVVTRVYDGKTNSERLNVIARNLKTGLRYGFTVSSYNFNGESLPSEELILVVCQPPAAFPRPTYVEASRTTITISWSPPSYLGGCPLL